MDTVIDVTKEFFQKTLDEYGASAQGVGWNGRDAQQIRYKILSKVIEEGDDSFTMCDYGCGVGYYLSFLREHYRQRSVKYVGYDILQDMLLRARENYGADDESHSFVLGEHLQDRYDYIVSSGIFNLKQDIEENKWKQYILETIEQFDKHSIKGFAFNALTKYSDLDKMRPDLYYSDPLFLFDYCKKNFSRNVALLHDYDLYDFTIIVRK